MQIFFLRKFDQTEKFIECFKIVRAYKICFRYFQKIIFHLYLMSSAQFQA